MSKNLQNNNNIPPKNININLHIGDPVQTEEEKNISKQNSNQNFINLQSIQTTANSNELNLNQSIDLINKDTLSNSNDENYSYEDEYYKEIYKNLILDENYFYQKIISQYMLYQNDINYKMREILVDWLIDVHFHCNFQQKTLFQCVLIMDALLSKVPIKKISFQLLGIAALLISCKENEIIYPSLIKFSQLTDNAYTPNQITFMEQKILKILKFDIFAPTSDEFFSIISEFFQFNEEQKYFGQYFLDCSLIDISFLKYKMSTIAIACVKIVMKYYKIDKINLLIEKCGGGNDDKKKEIENCEYNLLFSAKKISNSPLGAVKKKYKSEKFLNVAKLCEVTINDVE